MASKAGTGFSTELGAFTAGVAASRAALAEVEAQPDFCLVFGTSGYDSHELLRGVREVFPHATLAGCMGEGVIAGDFADERDRAVSVLAVKSSSLRFEVTSSRRYGDDPEGAASDLVEWISARRRSDALALLLFADGLQGDCTRFLRRLHAGLPPNLPALGGTAGDAMEFERTLCFDGTDALLGAVTAVLVSGSGQVRVGVSHGCEPVGNERMVTRAQDGWLHEIDGRSAWSVFKEYLDGDPEDLNAEGVVHLCLGERLPDDVAAGYDEYIVRTPLKLDKETGALFFPGGGLAAPGTIQFMRRDPARIRDSARRCGAAVRREDEKPLFVLQVECAGRGRIMFGSLVATHTVVPPRQAVGLDVPWIGFHSYGEIAPLATRPHFHNYSVVLCAVFDR
ncbi:MAG: FIST C-terminal domain-containing protein [Deltaproteobacteria bacterium]|nr:FIST C-terminal domain-containing protein [Deltaproteobacteria bacterium]